MNNKNSHAIWPSENYVHQIEKLKASIDNKVFLVELRPTNSTIAIRHTDQAYQLLAVIDFPKPEPEKGLFPHCILLDDGRGVNLGRIARISLSRPFDPSKEQIIFEENDYLNKLTSPEHRATKESIAATSKFLLGAILGKEQEQQPRQII